MGAWRGARNLGGGLEGLRRRWFGVMGDHRAAGIMVNHGGCGGCHVVPWECGWPSGTMDVMSGHGGPWVALGP